VLYEKRPVALPLGLKSGDRIWIRNCGAYTTTYASIGFNGFPPLDVVVL
jgi:ornithine decarboxylase